MDSHTISALARLEVDETGRRRRWTADEKARIVFESMAGPRLVAPTARRYNISRSMLVTWRRAFKAAGSEPQSRLSFVPAIVAEPATPRATTRGQAGRIEIVLPRDRHIIVDENVDPVALARVLDVLSSR